MEKPDIKQLGLELAEDTAQAAVKKIVKPYAQWYITQSENKIDDIILPFLDQLEQALVEAMDKIDGKED